MKKTLLTTLLSLLIPFVAVAQEAYAVYTDDGTLTFYYDNQKSSRSGTKYGMNVGQTVPGWYTDHRTDISKAVFDSSFSGARPTSTFAWFYKNSNLTEIIGWEYLNTGEVTNMGEMFSVCSKLTSIDLSHFDTSKVTNMRAMFDGCSGLTALDLTPLNTSMVTNMSFIFSDCSGLTALDLTPLNTSKVTDIRGMFWNCSSLTALDLAPLNTNNVTDMSYIFSGCSGLTALDLRPLNTSKVTNMYGMFSGCSGLTELDLTPLKTNNVTDMGEMFSGCSGLASLDLTPLKTNNVTLMYRMFSGCIGLTTLDLTPLNTSMVTKMSFMFDGCSGLTALDLTPLSTSNVTDMYGMFSNCSRLTTIYVDNNWNTDKVTSSWDMFKDCTNLVGGAGTKYDVNHTDASYAHIDGGPSNPGYLTDKNAVPQEKEAYAVYADDGILTFYYDNLRSSREGTSYDLNTGTNAPGWRAEHRKDIKKAVFTSSFSEARPTSTRSWFAVDFGEVSNLSEIVGWEYLNTCEVTNMSCMFSGCSELTSIDLSHFDTSKVTNMSYIFSGCSGLTELDLTPFNTSKVTDMSDMFFGCSGLTALDLTPLNTQNVTVMGYMFGDCSGLTALDLTPLNTNNVKNMQGMFRNCSSLTALDLTPLNTQNVTNMGGIFWGCSGLTELDLTPLNTSNVTYMYLMFSNCSRLTELDLTPLNTSNVTYMHSMFSNCSGLTTIYVDNNWNTNKVTSSSDMFNNCISLVGGAGTKYDANHIDVSYAHIDGGPNNPGYLTDNNAVPQEKEAYAVYTDDGVLTFYYDNQRNSRGGTAYDLNTDTNDPGWYTDHRTDITKVVFDSSFSDARPTSTYKWFAIKGYPENSILSEIVGMQYLNTSAVTNMRLMFFDCSNLTSLDVSHFDTSNVTSMNSMFYFCSGLTSLDLSNFNTSKVVDMNYMFSCCDGLKSLDIRKFDTGKIIGMISMFYHCINLTSLDISHFNTSNVEYMGGMFSDCNQLTNLDVSYFDTRKVTDMNGMFSGCSDLTSLDVSNFDTRKVTHMNGMFNFCSGLTNLDVSHFNTSKVTNMEGMFSGCSGLTNLDITNFDTSKVTNMEGMFSNCSGLTSLDMTHFDTSKVTDMGRMFYGCSGLTCLDVSNFDTRNVTNMGWSWYYGMFQDCTNLTTIFVGENWNTGNVKDSGNMFLNCTSLVGGMGTKYDANHVGIEYAHIDGGASNPGYLTGKNVQAPVSDSDDLQDFINSLGDNKGTEDDPVNVPVDPNGLTIDNDVDIVDDLQLAINGNDTENKVHVCFWSGFFNIGQNSGLSFKNVVFASKDVAAAMQQRAAGNGSGIKNGGTLKFANCTFLPGEYTVENSSITYIGEGVTGCRLVNKTGGRINITSTLTDDLTIAVPTEADVEPDVAIVTGVSDTDHILMSLPSGYAYKYDATAGGIVVYSTTGITAVGQQTTVKYSYDTTGRKVDNNRKGLHIQRMSDGTVRKVMTNN